MATKDELTSLRVHWAQVIQHIYPDIEFIPKGSDASILTLLSNWEDTHPLPTEARLLEALVEVEEQHNKAAQVRADILAKVLPSVGVHSDWIVLDVAAKDSLLIALLLLVGALDDEGALRPVSEWAE